MYVLTATFFEPVGRHLSRDALLVPAEASCATVVERMSQAGAPCALVVDAHGGLVGIVTTGDVTRRVAFQLQGDDEVRRAMTAPVQSLREDEPLYRALARMRRHGWRRMPVVNGEGSLVGVFGMEAALERAMELIERIVGDDSVSGLGRVKAAQPELAAALLDGPHSVTEIQALFSEINLDIHRCIIALMLEAMAQDGWGEAPVPFSVIVMGSIGRSESLLHPDQDNGFVLDDHPENEGLVVDRFFAELAQRMVAALARVGFPPCRGKVMATNPVWCKTLSQWRRQVESWIASRSAAAILNADIYFDFRAASAPKQLARALRLHGLAALAQHKVFLRDMCFALVDRKVALGIFGGFHTEPTGDGQRINLKLRGLMPLVGAVRLLALRDGVAETSTLARIAALAAGGSLTVDERDAVSDAYRDLTYLLLRQQLADVRAGQAAGNLVSPAGWSRLRRQRLSESLRAVDDLQRRVREDFTGQVL